MNTDKDRNVKNEKGHSTPRSSKTVHSKKDDSTKDGLNIPKEEE